MRPDQQNTRDFGFACTAPAWTPFEPAIPVPLEDQALRELAALAGMSIAAARAEEERLRREQKLFLNSRYQVDVQRFGAGSAMDGMTHLSIKRLDKQPIHDWRDLQRVKNELVGPMYEAVEIYPAESRLVDTSNQYHLWVLPEGRQVPFGFQGRAVVDGEGGGSRQRPME